LDSFSNVRILEESSTNSPEIPPIPTASLQYISLFSDQTGLAEGFVTYKAEKKSLTNDPDPAKSEAIATLGLNDDLEEEQEREEQEREEEEAKDKAEQKKGKGKEKPTKKALWEIRRQAENGRPKEDVLEAGAGQRKREAKLGMMADVSGASLSFTPPFSLHSHITTINRSHCSDQACSLLRSN
jgi:hypothetical protein